MACTSQGRLPRNRPQTTPASGRSRLLSDAVGTGGPHKAAHYVLQARPCPKTTCVYTAVFLGGGASCGPPGMCSVDDRQGHFEDNLETPDCQKMDAAPRGHLTVLDACRLLTWKCETIFIEALTPLLKVCCPRGYMSYVPRVRSVNKLCMPDTTR